MVTALYVIIPEICSRTLCNGSKGEICQTNFVSIGKLCCCCDVGSRNRAETALYITGGGRLLKDATEETCPSASPAICTPLYEFSCSLASKEGWALREKQ